MNIRPAARPDLDRVRDCARQAYALYVPRMGKEPAPMVADFEAQIGAGKLHVVELEGEVAGFVVFYPRGDHLHVENVAVLPSAQGKGIGKALLGFAEDEARRLGLPAVELYTNVKMVENQAFYPALGYVETNRREEDGFSRVFYRKEL
ncbi:MAG: GNAT family N-acetyltransferase [Kiloniellales bacterium]|nr:GNAT family N-acetyltransferase [Kiloniellales bacterium]MDJ0970415.1 GNAT family N-acetyltransferase [Kiloniellales bacterium]